MKTIIMAGGQGKRAAGIDPTIPKPLIPIGSKPILQHEIECLVSQGFTDIIITLSHMAEQIKAFVGDGSRFGAAVTCFYEEQPMGNAGALFKLWERGELSGDFLLLNADSMFDVNLERFVAYHRARGGLATLFTHPNNHPCDSGLIVAEHGIVTRWVTKEEPRPQWYKNRVNAGLHILNTKLLELTGIDPAAVDTNHRVDLDRDILKPLVSTGRIFACDSPEYVKDMGTPERFVQVSKDLVSGRVAARNLSRPQKAVFLDRDGTINRQVGFLTDIDEFELLPGTASAIRKINESGYLCIVVTNQPVIARGEVTEPELARIHNKMETLLGQEGAYVDAIYYCPHHPDSGFAGEVPELKIRCDCRKPEPGMLLAAAEEFHIDLAQSVMVGDDERDILAGKNAGCSTILLGEESRDYGQDDTVETLEEAVRIILDPEAHLDHLAAGFAKNCRSALGEGDMLDACGSLMALAMFCEVRIRAGGTYHGIRELLDEEALIEAAGPGKAAELYGEIIAQIAYANNPPAELHLTEEEKKEHSFDGRILADLTELKMLAEEKCKES